VGHRFDPKHIEKLDNTNAEKRYPEEILKLLDVADGMEIADVGCGPGYFTLPVAHMTKGTVYAVDVSPEMLNILHERAEQEGLPVLPNV
jgi:ubiquinone/menaquinone biosynthesis C-methylase UbiE